MSNRLPKVSKRVERECNIPHFFIGTPGWDPAPRIPPDPPRVDRLQCLKIVFWLNISKYCIPSRFVCPLLKVIAHYVLDDTYPTLNDWFPVSFPQSCNSIFKNH